MKALIDGDILAYEVGWGAETGWSSITNNPFKIPPWDYVEKLLDERIERILAGAKADIFTLYMTAPLPTFRDDIAITKPYKGHRVANKPWHWQNLRSFMTFNYPCYIAVNIEADDAMAIEHIKVQKENELAKQTCMCGNHIDHSPWEGHSSVSMFDYYGPYETIICSRDKDLRQVPGWHYTWELGNQPSFGPVFIKDPGTLMFDEDKRTLSGTGFAWFCAQMIMGDKADNIPGLQGKGPRFAYEFLYPILEMDPDNLLPEVKALYNDDIYFEEQRQLLWILRDG